MAVGEVVGFGLAVVEPVECVVGVAHPGGDGAAGPATVTDSDGLTDTQDITVTVTAGAG